jgi:hypothetical protein
LPKSFPVGAVYVVEGRGGEQGRLNISARYVIMPGGKRIDVTAKQQEAVAPPVRRRLRLVSSRGPAARQKEPSPTAKKFLNAAGTTRQARR